MRLDQSLINFQPLVSLPSRPWTPQRTQLASQEPTYVELFIHYSLLLGTVLKTSQHFDICLSFKIRFLNAYCRIWFYYYSCCCYFPSDRSEVRLEDWRGWNRRRPTLAPDGESERLRRDPSHLQWSRDFQRSGKNRWRCCASVTESNWLDSATVGKEVEQGFSAKRKVKKGSLI